MQKLATARLIEEYLAEHGLSRQDKLREKTLEAHSITTLWLSLNNQIREDLKLLGLERRALEAEVLTPQELLAAAAEDEAKERENRDVCACAGRLAGDEGQESGSSDDYPDEKAYGE
jgi:hypothetical protein